MSLINDALRKARFEAARQDSTRRGVPLPAVELPRSGAPAARVGWVVAAVALLLLVGAALYFVGRRSALQETAQTASVAETAEAAAATGAEPPPGSEARSREAEPPPAAAQAPARRAGPPPETAPNPSPAPPPAESAPRAAAASPTPQGARIRVEDPRPAGTLQPGPAREPAPRAQRTPPPPAEPAAPRTATPPAAAAGPPVFVSSARLGGNVTLELGGIAWSENRPFALINGNVVGPGDRVDGFTVVEIQPRQVELQGPDDALILQLK